MWQGSQPARSGADSGIEGARDEWAPFRINGRNAQHALLQQLHDGGVPVALSAPQGGVVSSRLCAFDATQGQLSFSTDGDSLLLRQLAGGDEAVAVAFLDRVKLQFDLNGLVLVHGERRCTLRARWPESIYRFQRRAAFRIHTLDRRTPQARFRHPSMPDMRLALRIVDISVGGCALLLPPDVPELQPGSLLSAVQVAVDGDTAFDATLRLMHVSATPGGGHGTRLGCEFVGLDAAAQRALQRCIDQTQQRRRLLAPL